MRKFILAAVATLAVTAAAPSYADTLLSSETTDFSAQAVIVDTPGIDVRIGRDRPRRWESRRHRRTCRTITVRERRPNGTIVVRKRTRC